MKSPRAFAIGDIHGCSTALKTLLKMLDLQWEDTVITLGDHVDWGPDSKGVVDQLLALDQTCWRVSLLGNHEEMMIDALQGRMELWAWGDLGGEATTGSYAGCARWEDLPASHRNFLNSCQPSWETAAAIFVHANYAPNRTMPQQSSYDLFWLPLEESQAAPHYSGKTVFCGHTPQTTGEVLDLGFLVCLDTDCSRGGWLTALEIETGRIWQANQGGESRFSMRPNKSGRSLG